LVRALHDVGRRDEAGRWADAEPAHRQALQLNPRSAVARDNLGLALANLDQPDQALAAWQAASSAATAHNNLAAVLIEKEKYPEARRQLEIALSYTSLRFRGT